MVLDFNGPYSNAPDWSFMKLVIDLGQGHVRRKCGIYMLPAGSKSRQEANIRSLPELSGGEKKADGRHNRIIPLFAFFPKIKRNFDIFL